MIPYGLNQLAKIYQIYDIRESFFDREITSSALECGIPGTLQSNGNGTKAEISNIEAEAPEDYFGHLSISDPSESVILEVPQKEERSLAQWINNNLECDEDCSHLLPLESDGGDLYQKIGDGILLW